MRGEQPARLTEYGSTVDELWCDVEARRGVTLSWTTETSQRRMSGGTGAELAPETNEATNVSKEGGDAEQISAAEDANGASSPPLDMAAAYAAQLAETEPPPDPSEYPLLRDEDRGGVEGYYHANKKAFFTDDGSEADSKCQRKYYNDYVQLPLSDPPPTSKPFGEC